LVMTSRSSFLLILLAVGCAGEPGVQIGQPGPESPPGTTGTGEKDRELNDPPAPPESGTPNPECSAAPALVTKATCTKGVNTTEWDDIDTLPIPSGETPLSSDLQFDGSGGLHAAMITSGGTNEYMQYATNGSGAWVVEKVATALDAPAESLSMAPPRVAIDACNNVTLLYNRVTQHSTSGAITTQFFVAKKKAPNSVLVASWRDELVPVPDSDTNPSPSKRVFAGDIAFDKANRLHFVGRSDKIRALELSEPAALASRGWGVTTADHGTDLPVFAAGAFAFDTRPLFFVPEAQSSFPALVEANGVGGRLVQTVVSNKKLPPPKSDLHGAPPLAAAVDRFGTVHVIWRSSFDPDEIVWYARRQKNEPWSVPELVVQSSEGPFDALSLVVGPTLIPYVMTSPARIHMRTGGVGPTATWKEATIPGASSGSGFITQSLAIDGSGRLYVLQGGSAGTRLLKQKCL
jgi:hypothetical protein